MHLMAISVPYLHFQDALHEAAQGREYYAYWGPQS